MSEHSLCVICGGPLELGHALEVNSRSYSHTDSACCVEVLAWRERSASAEARSKRLRDLLIEWREAPYFDDHAKWLAWVLDFGGRVDAALAAPVAEEPKP